MAEFFSINNGGQNEGLEKFKHGVRKDQLTEKQKKLFDIFDANKNGTLEAEETEQITDFLSQSAGDDKVLNSAENQQAASVFASKFGTKNADFMDFVKSVSDATKDIQSSEEQTMDDGGKAIITKYKNGIIERIEYYPDGEFKVKITDEPRPNITLYQMSTGEEIEKKEFEENLKKTYEKDKSFIEYTKSKLAGFERGESAIIETAFGTITVTKNYKFPNFSEYKNMVIKAHKIRQIEVAQNPKISIEKSARLQGEEIANAMYNSINSHTGALNEDDFKAALNKITTENIVEVIKEYGKISPQESLLKAILGEQSNNDAEMKEVLTGNNGIFTKLLKAAEEKGIDEKTLKYIKESFETELDNALSGVVSLVYVNTERLEEIMNTLVQLIENKTNFISKDEEPSPVSSGQAQIINTNNLIIDRYNRALEDFNNQLKQDGWTGDAADLFGRIWGSNNTATKVREAFNNFYKQIEELKKARQDANLKGDDKIYTDKFYEIFKIPYNPENIRIYQEVEAQYKTAIEAKRTEDTVNESLSYFLKNGDLKEEYDTVMPDPETSVVITTNKRTKEDVYRREFYKFASILGQNGVEVLNTYLKEQGVADKSVEKRYEALRKFAQQISAQLHTETEKACGGQSFENLEKRYNNCYRAAFGLENDLMKRVHDYNISQQKGAGIVKGITVAAVTVAATLLTRNPELGAAIATLVSAGIATGATAVVEVTDRFTSKEALDVLKNEGFLAYLEKGYEITDWSQIAKSAALNGAITVTLGGVSYGVSNLCKWAGAGAYTTVAATTGVDIAAGTGTEYLLTGEVTIEGVAFVVVFSAGAAGLQVKHIARKTSEYTAIEKSNKYRTAKETLNIEENVKISEQELKAKYKQAKSRNDISDVERAQIEDAYKVLKKNLKEVNSTIHDKPVTPEESEIGKLINNSKNKNFVKELQKTGKEYEIAETADGGYILKFREGMFGKKATYCKLDKNMHLQKVERNILPDIAKTKFPELESSKFAVYGRNPASGNTYCTLPFLPQLLNAIEKLISTLQCKMLMKRINGDMNKLTKILESYGISNEALEICNEAELSTMVSNLEKWEKIRNNLPENARLEFSEACKNIEDITLDFASGDMITLSKKLIQQGKIKDSEQFISEITKQLPKEQLTVENVQNLLEAARYPGGCKTELGAMNLRNDATLLMQDPNSIITVKGSNRKVYMSEKQKAIYEQTDISSLGKEVVASYSEQLIMSDTMFIEALATKLGINPIGKTKSQLFIELKNMYNTNKTPFEKIISSEYWDFYFDRAGVNEPITGYSNIIDAGGYKIVHELNKSLAAQLEVDTGFRNNWIEYCKQNETAADYMRIAETYKQDYYNKVREKGGEKIPLENIDHIIFRALERNATFFTSKNWSTNVLDSFIDELVEITTQGKIPQKGEVLVPMSDEIGITYENGKYGTVEYIEWRFGKWTQYEYIPQF